jgi:hypothetical protein
MNVIFFSNFSFIVLEKAIAGIMIHSSEYVKNNSGKHGKQRRENEQQ